MKTFRLTYMGKGVVHVPEVGLFQVYTTAYVGEELAAKYLDQEDWSCVEIVEGGDETPENAESP